MLETVSPRHYRLHGHIDMQESSDVLQELMALPQSPAVAGGDLWLDVGSLDTADSLLLAALLDLQRKLARTGKLLRVQGLPESMLGLARVYGIDALMENMLPPESIRSTEITVDNPHD